MRNARELGFESRILGKHVARTYALESLIICSFLRGLSVRDVEAALEETFDELRAPALIVADGAPGLWKAARELWPAAEQQRCTRCATPPASCPSATTAI